MLGAQQKQIKRDLKICSEISRLRRILTMFFQKLGRKGKGRGRLRKHIPCKAEVRKTLEEARASRNVSRKREVFGMPIHWRNGIAVRN